MPRRVIRLNGPERVDLQGYWEVASIWFIKCIMRVSDNAGRVSEWSNV